MIRNRIASTLASMWLLFAASDAAHSATITLSPGQSIQAAITAAQNGDRIELQPGVYAGTIDFLGKKITITGLNGAYQTTLDGTGFNKAVVTFKSGETLASILERVTIRGGHGATKAGGGIRVENFSAPWIRDCRIVSNTAVMAPSPFGDWGGGGIGSRDSSPRIERCIISGNTAPQGAGIFILGSNPSVRDCVIDANNGIGLFAKYATLELIGTRIEDHTQAGAELDNTYLEGSDCVFARNADRGLLYDQGYDDVRIQRMVFLENFTADPYGGGGLVLHSGPTFGGHGPKLTIENCLFVRNSAPQGSALHATGDDEAIDDLTAEDTRIESCTFIDNGPGSVVTTGGMGVWFHNSIVRGSAPLFSTQPWAPSESTMLATYSNIEGGFSGLGNVDIDPLFAEPAADDYHLQAGSPCLGLGDPLGPTPLLDFDGNARGAAGTNDLGYDELRANLAITGDLDVGGTARIAIYDVPQSQPAVLILSPTLGPGVGAFGLGNPLLPIVFPVIPSTGFLAATATVPPGIQPIRVYAQAWTGSSFTAVERIDLW